MHVQPHGIHARSARALTAAALAFLTLTACAKDETKEAAGDVTPGAAAPAAATVAVADIELGRGLANARVTDKTDDFRTTDTVYTSVRGISNDTMKRIPGDSSVQSLRKKSREACLSRFGGRNLLPLLRLSTRSND